MNAVEIEAKAREASLKHEFCVYVRGNTVKDMMLTSTALIGKPFVTTDGMAIVDHQM